MAEVGSKTNLAAARNALRRKFRRNNNDVRPLAPDELENETGAQDLVIELKPVGPVKADRMRRASSQSANLEPDNAEKSSDPTAEESTNSITKTENTVVDDGQHKEQVKGYVNSIIQDAVARVKSETSDKEKKASESLTSSTVSVIAALAVRDSLSRIAASTSENDSANVPNNVKSATSIASSEISQMAEVAVAESLSKIAATENEVNATLESVACAKSATSIASSDISQIAELAVSDSLSKIATNLDENNNNINGRRPRSKN